MLVTFPNIEQRLRVYSPTVKLSVSESPPARFFSYFVRTPLPVPLLRLTSPAFLPFRTAAGSSANRQPQMLFFPRNQYFSFFQHFHNLFRKGTCVAQSMPRTLSLKQTLALPPLFSFSSLLWVLFVIAAPCPSFLFRRMSFHTLAGVFAPSFPVDSTPLL